MDALRQKLGLIEVIFFAATAPAAAVSLFLLFVRGVGDAVVRCWAKCSVCGAALHIIP